MSALFFSVLLFSDEVLSSPSSAVTVNNNTASPKCPDGSSLRRKKGSQSAKKKHKSFSWHCMNEGICESKLMPASLANHHRSWHRHLLQVSRLKIDRTL